MSGPPELRYHALVGRRSRTLVVALLLPGCEIIDPGPDAGVAQRCAVAPSFFIERIVPEFLEKHDCRDVGNGGCHDIDNGTGIYRLRGTSDVLTPSPTEPLPTWPEVWQLNFEETASEIHDCDIAEDSPLYKKPSGRETHGGGKLFNEGGAELELIDEWLMTAG